MYFIWDRVNSFKGWGTAGMGVLRRHTKHQFAVRPRGLYGGFEYTDEKLSTRRIQWCGVKFYIFFFGEL